MTTSSGSQARPSRVLGTADAVTLGASAMVGAGVFAVFAPAAEEAGAWLLVALLIAAVVAYCNATSSARLAARHPESGGTYVYGRERLGEMWGYLAGWAFTVGKTASCAVMALTFAAYVAPEWSRPLAVGAVVCLTAVNYTGLRKSTGVARILLALVLAVLAAVVAVALGGSEADARHLDVSTQWPGFFGLLGAAGMLFFAFAGYARIATLGGEVRDPSTTIPRAIGLALAGVFVVYLLVGASVLTVLGRERLAASAAPLADTAVATGWPQLVPAVTAGAAAASLGALLALILGVSRTVAAMAADGHLPRFLARVHDRFGVPHRAELAVGAGVCVLVLAADLGDAIGFSAFGVLAYYAIANASALRLGPDENRPPLLVPVVGLAGCVVLAFSLPLNSVIAGVGVLALGAALWWVRRVLPGLRS
ncbi:APC family permease [Streptomonospora nanhaiensis]|uniref:APA family basic amino acid/polyamine antiporter n=1 Tax=Streptomonospora nanhaiensis TaxID=1323731 RepID=A0A853BIL6_9ACTN|nr:APC family permease [Streptomonospora nanhaiensis]MBX9387919.1 APC family permease [Streptomonospora nanhaiensis]NYI94432.1 APA family basic amino acid/polyamine antiporter [Streptomonospora nanhaiensis]